MEEIATNYKFWSSDGLVRTQQSSGGNEMGFMKLASETFVKCSLAINISDRSPPEQGIKKVEINGKPLFYSIMRNRPYIRFAMDGIYAARCYAVMVSGSYGADICLRQGFVI